MSKLNKEDEIWNLIKDMKKMPQNRFFHIVRSTGICKRKADASRILESFCLSGRLSITQDFQVIIHKNGGDK